MACAEKGQIFYSTINPNTQTHTLARRFLRHRRSVCYYAAVVCRIPVHTRQASKRASKPTDAPIYTANTSPHMKTLAHVRSRIYTYCIRSVRARARVCTTLCVCVSYVCLRIYFLCTVYWFRNARLSSAHASAPRRVSLSHTHSLCVYRNCARARMCRGIYAQCLHVFVKYGSAGVRVSARLFVGLQGGERCKEQHTRNAVSLTLSLFLARTRAIR